MMTVRGTGFWLMPPGYERVDFGTVVGDGYVALGRSRLRVVRW